MRIHPNELALEGLYLSLGPEHRVLLGHLNRCSSCRNRLQILILRHLQGASPREEAGYEEMLDRSEQVLESRQAALSKERIEAPSLFVELTSCPAERRDLLLRESCRFYTWGVFELLIERSLEVGIRDPPGAETLAFLALRISDHLDFAYYGIKLVEDLRARAWAHLANSRRLRADLHGAEEAFERAEAHLKRGTRDAVEKAILLDLKASLRRAQRRFEEALRLLRRAVGIFTEYGHLHRAGRSLVNMSTVHHYRGRPEEGVPQLTRALELIDPEQEPRLLLCARHNLADLLASSGRFALAQEMYRQTRPLYRDFTDEWTQNRRKWVKGRIVRGLGQAAQAESLFLAARDGFIEEGVPYDTALVSLELATLYAEQGRTADLKQLATGLVPIFSSLEIHREALAALAYFRQATEAEAATIDLVSRVAAYLRRAEHDPAVRFDLFS